MDLYARRRARGLVPSGRRRRGPGLRPVDRPGLGLLLCAQEADRLRCDERPGPHRPAAGDAHRFPRQDVGDAPRRPGRRLDAVRARIQIPGWSPTPTSTSP
ncbi:MAG: hypothetical protein M0C28_07035 [Candidatus Moduliflexus flocculans]|nr:hypothetical protein [Candidatus Moduliflexus flocculans]